MAAVVLLLAVAVSCNSAKKSFEESIRDKVKVEKVENFSANSLTSYDLTLRVVNDTRITFQIEDSTVDIFYAGSKLGSIVSDAVVEVPKRAATSVDLPLSLTIENPLAIYGAYSKIQRGEIDRITISLKTTVKAAGTRRIIERNNIPLASVLSMFGADASDIQKLLKF